MNKIITQQELDCIFLEFQEKGSVCGLNGYDAYILECKKSENTKVNSKGKPNPGIEKHHILPSFDGGSDRPENMVLLTVKEHVIAHWLRWKVLGKRGDYTAYLFRVGNTEEALASQRQAVLEARERDRINQQGFFNSNLQRERGRRGGPIGGAANSTEQFLARQRVGQTYGRQTGIGNQGSVLSEFIKKYTLWKYNNRNSPTNDEFFVLVCPKDSFVDITRVLNAFAPESIRVPSAMHKVVYEERGQMYGWRIVTTLTRSEVEEGIILFKRNNPDAIFIFDEKFALEEGFE